MKLIRSKKNGEEKKNAQELYPKVKTFSKAYDFSPSKQETPADRYNSATSFHLDERPYAVVPVNAAFPENITASVETDDPERIDLQDTLLTDESFTKRLPKRPPAPAEKKEEKIIPPESEQSFAEPADSGISGPVADFEPDSEDETEPFYEPEPEAEYETESFFAPGYGQEEKENTSYTDPGPDEEDDSASFYIPDDDLENEQEPAPDSSSETEDEPDTESGKDTAGIDQLFLHLEAKGKTSLTASWHPVEDADGYDLFFAQGGKSFDGVYRTLSPEETAFTFSQLDRKSVYKLYISAFMLTGSQKTTICESDTVRCITGGSTKKHTNAQKIRTKEKSVSLSVGEKKKISASVTGQDPDKQILTHDGLLRFLSEDTSVATVSKDGKIRGIAPGNCRIFLFAANGIHSSVDVSVHENAAAVAFRKKKYALKVGKTINLKKKLNAKPDKQSGALKWKSSDRKIAEVSRKGIVTALKKGRITVRVKTGEGEHAKVRIRINGTGKQNPVPWETFGKKKYSE